MKSATAAQKELVAEGKLSSNLRSEDGQWSEGLVSAVSAWSLNSTNLSITTMSYTVLSTEILVSV